MSTRSIRNLIALGAVLAAALVVRLVGAGELPPDVHVLRADFGIGAATVAIIGLVSSFFGMFRGKVDLSTKLALDGMRGGIVDLGKKLVEGLIGLGGHIAHVVGVIKRFIQKTIGPLFTMLRNLVQRIARILDKIFGPIIDFLMKIRGHLLKFYNKVLKPIIDTIEMVRAFLRLLSFFGIDWSKKLDEQLAELEQFILAPYEFLVGKINEALNWINRIVTVDGLLQRFALLNSLIRDVKIVNGLWWKSNHRPMSATTREKFFADVPTSGADAIPGQFDEYVRTGGGPLAGLIDETLADAFLIARSTRLGV